MCNHQRPKLSPSEEMKLVRMFMNNSEATKHKPAMNWKQLEY